MNRLVVSLLATVVAAPLLAAEPARSRNLLEELTNAPGPSGFEGPVREILRRELQAAGAAVSTDGLGSVIGELAGPAGSPRVMLIAHMDEVGLMVRQITPDGFLRVQTLGGFARKTLVDKRWTILTHRGPLTAISGVKSAHITDASDAERVTPPEELFLDLGAASRDEAEALGVRVGDPVSPWSPFVELANGRYAAKAFDDRVGVAMLIETARRLRERNLRLPVSLYFVGSVQEEVGTRGAQTAAQRVRPDLGIALEVGVAGDHPGVRDAEAQSKLGAGPSIFLYEASMLPNLKLRDLFVETAESRNIPLQTDIISRYGQDASVVQRHSEGTPTIAFGVPTRYLHTFISVIDSDDFEQAVELLIAVLQKMDVASIRSMTEF